MVLYQSRHDATEYGRLAQLVEHLLDVQEVTGSSPVPSTTKIPSQMTRDFLRGRYRTRTARPRRRRGKQQPSGLLFSARFPTRRNVYQESTACQSIFSASASSNNHPIAKGRVSPWRWYPAFCASGMVFRLAVWYTRLNKSEFTSTQTYKLLTIKLLYSMIL